MAPTGSDDGDRVLHGSPDSALDRRLELLAHRDRRLVVATLAENGDDRLPVGVLTDAIVQDRTDSVDPQSVLIDLHHVHLPKLQRADIVDYLPDESMVRYRGDEPLERCLRALGGVDSG